MEHKEYKNIIEDADKAILFIHGIVGTPNHFNDFVKLVPKYISVYNLLLDGHGKGVKDFSATSMKKWETQVRKAIKELSLTHKEIYIVAHSMGSLLAIEQAINNDCITKLFLLAVPIKLFLKPRMISNILKIYFNMIKPNDHVAIAAKNCYGIDNDKYIFNYIGWVPRYLELFSKIRYTRKILELLRTPCNIFQSSKDEMIPKSSKSILQKNPAISVVELKNSGHYYYDDNDYELLIENFEKWAI